MLFDVLDLRIQLYEAVVDLVGCDEVEPAFDRGPEPLENSKKETTYGDPEKDDAEDRSEGFPNPYSDFLTST